MARFVRQRIRPFLAAVNQDDLVTLAGLALLDLLNPLNWLGWLNPLNWL